MRISILLTVIMALVALAGVLIVGQLIIQPNQPLIAEATFAPEIISPNADGQDDIALFSYSLSRNATISVTLTSDTGETHYFRQNESRIPGDYQVLFSGVVDGFTLPDEQISGEVLRRLIPDGQYTWKLEAEDSASGETQEMSGTLVIEGGDTTLPEMVDFSVAPDIFTPNQDGIRDRTQINVYLSKAAELTVYLEGQNGERIYISERQEGRKLGEAGRHLFDYEGGVDLGADPPQDGTYTVYAITQDAVGQQIQQTASLTINNGGKPLAEIIPQPVGASVVFDAQTYSEDYFTDAEQNGSIVQPPADPENLSLTAITMPVGEVLIFKLTIENYSDVPIRTTGPQPGTVYQQDQRAATLGWYDESGAWRVGLDCDTAPSDYPWRWALGTADNLVAEEDPETGITYHYLPAGAQSVVWGAVRMTELVEARNPQNCWAGLIHEDVEVSLQNSHVGAREIELVDPSASVSQ